MRVMSLLKMIQVHIPSVNLELALGDDHDDNHGDDNGDDDDAGGDSFNETSFFTKPCWTCTWEPPSQPQDTV